MLDSLRGRDLTPQEKEIVKQTINLFREKGKGEDIHNQRVEKYDYEGNPQFGRDWETSLYTDKQKARKKELYDRETSEQASERRAEEAFENAFLRRYGTY